MKSAPKLRLENGQLKEKRCRSNRVRESIAGHLRRGQSHFRATLRVRVGFR